MQNTLKTIQDIYRLSPEALELLLGVMEPMTLIKNDLIISTDKVERYLYFIETGMARAYCNMENQQVTFWFGQEGDVILSYHSYINHQPGYENIALLEDSVVYRVANMALQKLYAEHVELANWGRKLAEQELIKTEERFINRQFKTATERYHELVNQQPALLKRVQLGYIASYLGVTQVTLSRIRAELK